MYHNNKEYKTLNQWVKIFNIDYKEKGIKVDCHKLRILFSYYGLSPIGSKYPRFSVNDVMRMRTMREDFMEILRRVNNGEKPSKINDNDYSEEFKNGENDMEKYSNFLIQKYNESKNMPKKIVISENSFKKLFEGIHFNAKDDGTINTYIDTSSDDYNNKLADTRVFGTKNNILMYKDGKSKYIEKYDKRMRMNDFYNEIIRYARNNFQGDINLPTDVNTNTLNAYKEKMKYLYIDDSNIVYNGERYNKIDDVYSSQIIQLKNGTFSLNDDKTEIFESYEDAKNAINNRLNDKQSIEDWANMSLHRRDMFNGLMKNKIDRLSDGDGNDRYFRYDILKLPGIGLKVISLFACNDFNFSDSIKNANLRQGALTDKLLGISSSEREREQSISPGRGQLKKLSTTYDNNLTRNVAQNFSLNNVTNGHYKDQYAYQDGNNTDDKYTSINQFLDKSIIYASTILKKEKFSPTYIISVPSSSKYNLYYCTNLSNKLGVPYLKNFFTRNVINTTLDKDRMRNDGFNETQIFDLEQNIIKSKLSEITSRLKKCSDIFVNSLMNEFQILGEKTGHDYKEFIPFIGQYVYNSLVNMEDNDDNFIAYVLNNYLNDVRIKDLPNKTRKGNDRNNKVLINGIKSIVRHQGKELFNTMVENMKKLLDYYREKLKDGDKLNFLNKNFKITDTDKRYRKYLGNVYVVLDDYLNKDKMLFSRFTNPSTKFLLFDEDINTGESLRLSAEALKYQLMVSKENEMMKNGFINVDNSLENEIEAIMKNNTVCLVNASSDSGK